MTTTTIRRVRIVLEELTINDGEPTIDDLLTEAFDQTEPAWSRIESNTVAISLHDPMTPEHNLTPQNYDAAEVWNVQE